MIAKSVIAVVAGGYSSEREISLKSASVVMAHLNPDEFEVHLIDIALEGWSHVAPDGTRTPVNRGDFSVSVPDGTIKFDAVFNAIHGTPGEDGKLTAYFDLLGIPYNTCGSFEAALTFEKGVCNQLLRQYGIKVGRSVLLGAGDSIDPEGLIAELGLPVFVKPSKAGSSYGVSKVKAADELEDAVAFALEFDDLVIVEEFLDGRELTCGVFEHRSEVTALPVTEIVSDNEFFDYEAKYKGESREVTPADIAPQAQKDIQETSQRIYQLLRLKGVCRMDYIVRNDVPHLIEVNSVPGLSEASIVPQQAQQFGLDLRTFFGDQLKRILNDPS
ncbi:D-alanine--D-alanine ligase [Cryomorphaceae bacterium]|nr:D-alanine--D-alanine ligase [Cryomorphaceae bacterium]